MGDAVHNMRSALDHLACRLVEKETPGADVTSISFPIREKDPTKGKHAKKSTASYNRLVEGMSDPDKNGIWALLPFHDVTASTSRMLLDLALLDNADKHQICLPTLTVIGEPMHTVTWAQVGPDLPQEEGETQINEGAPLRPHTPLARIRAFSGTDQIFFNIGLRSRAVYGGQDSVVGLAELREIRAHVVGIVESFAPG